MYERIVVPLDGSALAEQALDQALGLARLTGAPLHLIQVVDVPLSAGLADEAAVLVRALADEEAAARTYLDGVRRRLSGEDDLVGEATAESVPASDAPARAARPSPTLGPPSPVVTTDLRHGKVAPELLAARPGDLFVMTPHARSGLARWFLGSVTEEVVRHAPVPVLLVPTAEPAMADTRLVD